MHVLTSYTRSVIRSFLSLMSVLFLLSLSSNGQNSIVDYSPGAYVIDMGKPVQTVANGLKPYGLVYALIKAGIPVDWAIDDAKTKDGKDFSKNGNYYGSAFIIRAEWAVQATALVNTWRTLGVNVDLIATGFSAPVYKTLTIWPTAFLDSDNDTKITPYYSNAGIPSSTYFINTNPTMLPQCGSINGSRDVYILPHADPDDWDITWVTALQNFIHSGGSMWASCHAVSVLENLPGCNFLSNGGLVPYGSHGNGNEPYTYNSSGDPIMQFIRTLDGATQNGSEQIYIPGPSGWRATTTIAVYDPDYTNDGITYPTNAAVVAYGPAFGDNTKGTVMYEAGHALNNGGTEAEKVAAQRAFFNFLLLAGSQTQYLITPPVVADQTTITCSDVPFAVTPSGVAANTNYSWTAPTGTGFTGGSAQTSWLPSISQTLTTTTTNPATAVYTVIPKTGGCVGPPFTVTVILYPMTLSVSGAGTFCENTTLTASGGIGGTIYFQGTTSGGTSTANPSSSQVVNTSDTYYFRAQSAGGCWSQEVGATVIINKPTTQGVSICPNGAGVFTASSTCLLGSSTNAGKFPGIGTNQAGIGTTDWQNPNSILSNDDTRASVTLSKNQISHYLQATQYGFNIPANSVISGIQVTIGRHSSGNNIRDFVVSLLKAGTVTGNNYAVTTANIPNGTETAKTYGDITNLWGTSWTSDDINNTNFGVAFSLESSDNNRTVNVDYISISVTYTPPGDLNWYTASSGGVLIGTGSPFNPVGIAGSGLPDTQTPGTYHFWAECSTVPGCRAATGFIIHPQPQGSLTANGPFCTTGSGQLTWTATAGTGPYTLIYNDGTADRIQANVTSGISFPVFTTPVITTTGYTLISVQDANCSRSSGFTNGSATITVDVLPIPVISGDASVFAGSTNNVFTTTVVPADNVSHSWSVSGNGTITGPATGPSVTVEATAAGSFTLTDNISRFSCTSSATFTVSVVDLPCDISPVASVPTGSSEIYSAPAGMDSYNWSVTGNGSITSGVNNQAVTVLAGNSCAPYTITLNLAKHGAGSTCQQTITVTDNQPPAFTPPPAVSECVESITTAIFNGADMDINPTRPDYFILTPGNGLLDLDLSTFTDNCPVSCAVAIRYKIEMADGTLIPAPPALFLTGQPSAYGSDIKFAGDGVTFNSTVHTITYWIVDCAGNVSAPQTRSLTINPRPNITKAF